jgi:hypothetical protein
MVLAAGLIAPSAITAVFAHPHIVLTPDETDHQQMNANPIILTLGHGNEPAFGAMPGIHDGKHNFELFIEDAATTLPLAGANLTLDRYYFSDIQSFENATSPTDATEVDSGIRLGAVFGETGVYSVRQIVKEGIYGYRVYGTVDYFGAAQIPIDSTVFCTSSVGNTTKFNSPGWEGSYGCVQGIDSLLFPKDNEQVSQMVIADETAQPQQSSHTGSANAASIAGIEMNAALSGIIPAIGLVAFLGLRKYKKREQ